MKAKRVPALVSPILCAAAILIASCGAGAGGGEPAPSQPRLSGQPVGAAEESLAARRLQAARAAYETGDYAAARSEAQAVIDRWPAASAAVPALWLTARAAYELGEFEAAVDAAERYAALFAPRSDEAGEAAALVRAARESSAAAPAAAPPETAERSPVDAVRIGVILPLSGSPYLVQYAERIREGIELAERQYTEVVGQPVELVVRDNQGEPGRTAALVRELETAGVVGIIGPLVDASVERAAAARRNRSLVIVSPTAGPAVRRLHRVHTLNAADTRGAAALAEYVDRAAYARVATLYPRTETHARQARHFEARLRAAGLPPVASVAYDSGTTTFTEPLSMIEAIRPQAVYIPAPARDVRQIAPQIAYYGLDSLGVQIFGGRDWVSDEILRMVAPRHVEGVIAATPLLESSPEIGWGDFVTLYENTYRRSVDDHFPALGYDALRMLLAAVPIGGAGASEVSVRFTRLSGVRGATGVLSVADDEIVRRPFLVRVSEGQVEIAPPPEMLFPVPLVELGDSSAAGASRPPDDCCRLDEWEDREEGKGTSR